MDTMRLVQNMSMWNDVRQVTETSHSLARVYKGLAWLEDLDEATGTLIAANPSGTIDFNGEYLL
jgi:hypothetical protein